MARILKFLREIYESKNIQDRIILISVLNIQSFLYQRTIFYYFLKITNIKLTEIKD